MSDREIKFRGKRVDNGEGVKGFYLKHPFKDDPTDFVDCIVQDERPYQVIPESVGLYTGRKDRSGVDEWEGDIVKMRNGTLKIIYFGRTRTEEPYGFALQALDKSGFSHDFRNIDIVIGNVHENKELLKVK